MRDAGFLPSAVLDEDDGSTIGFGSTCAGSSISSDEDGESIIGRWITEKEDFVTFDPPRGPVDMPAPSLGYNEFEYLNHLCSVPNCNL